MKKRLFIIGLGMSVLVFGEGAPISPEMVAAQLKDAEKEFAEAKKMFNPWYAGPLLTPGAHVIDPGSYNIQPYVFLTNNYKHYTESGHSEDVPHLKVVNPQLVFQFGLLKWVDGVIAVQTVSNFLNGHSATGLGDTSLSLGFGVLEEKPYTPAILINIQEKLPTGKYKNLSSSLGGIDGAGGGAFTTTVSLNMSKVVWWVLTHPMNIRGSIGYTFPSIARVKGFHAYGGGYGTQGNIHTPNAFSGDFAIEYSFTQRWVIACDAVYTYSAKTIFVGAPGVDALGNKASNGGPFSDTLSFAPALEYNPSPNMGLLAGIWFSAWGRNAADFVSAVVSLTYSF